MTIVEAARAVTGGIDTHGEVHVAAVLDEVGGLLGSESFRADPEGYSELWPGWKPSARSARSGVEGTGSYGAGIARHLARAGVHVVEVDRQNRQARRQVASPIPSMPSKPLGLLSRAGPMARQEPGRLGRGHPGPRRGQALGWRSPDQGADPDAPTHLQRS